MVTEISHGEIVVLIAMFLVGFLVGYASRILESGGDK